eukprot:6194717-Pleurochrysis_carterae.AAC.1
MSLHTHQLACRVLDAVSGGMQLKVNDSEGGVEIPPFKIDNASTVEFFRAVLDSAVGTRVYHSFSLSEAVAKQISQLFLSAKDSKREQAFAPHAGLPTRVPAPSTNALKRLANFVTRKRGGKGSVE